MANEDGVRITSEQIYGKVVGMEGGLARVEALLEKHIALEEQRSEGIEVRLENHGTRLGDLGTQHANLEGRVTQNESDLRSLKESHDAHLAAQDKRDSRKAPWWNTVTAIVAIVGVPGMLIALLVSLANFTQALTHLP